MGDFDILISYLSVFFLGIIIYKIINSFFLRDLVRRFGTMKDTRKDFYECGFRPTTQKPIKMPIQFLIICIFFLIYDMEFAYLFPIVIGGPFSLGFFDFVLFFFFFSMLILALYIDYDRQVLL